MVHLSRAVEGRRTLSTIRELAAQIIVQRREFGLTPASNSRVTAGAAATVDPQEELYDLITDRRCADTARRILGARSVRAEAATPSLQVRAVLRSRSPPAARLSAPGLADESSPRHLWQCFLRDRQLKYRAGYISVGKKNGKSYLIGGLPI